MSSPEPPAFPTAPSVVIGPPEILQRAGSEVARLAMLPRWTPAFAESSPGTPLLVRRLDQKDRYYYIVSYHVGTRVTARLQMNAHTGNYWECIRQMICL